MVRVMSVFLFVVRTGQVGLRDICLDTVILVCVWTVLKVWWY